MRISGHRGTNGSLTYCIYFSFLACYLCIGFLLRIVLLFLVGGDVDLSWMQVLESLGYGLLADFGMGVLLGTPVVITHLGLTDKKYGRRTGWMILAGLTLALAYTFLPNNLCAQYGGGVPVIARVLLGWKLLSFALRFFVPSIRKRWRKTSLFALWGVYFFLMLCIEISEYIFWDEFGVRFNFIAVDYLIYTNEVVGNIMESYPIIPMTLGVILVSVLMVWTAYKIAGPAKALTIKSARLLADVSVHVLLCGLGLFLLSHVNGKDSNNQYIREIQRNGSCSFLIAFQSHTLDYDQFYSMMPEDKCRVNYQKYTGLGDDGYKRLATRDTVNRPNIVLVTIESMSASFMERHGNEKHITPNLDSLARKGITFDHLYANGNRTVRGLEALSLCIPPCAGESVVKRADNQMGDLSVGEVLRSQLGYNVQFIYGGDSYFDNMGDFFSHNGYEVIDRSQISSAEITHANIWGVCDGDVFSKSLKVFDENYAQGKPFFSHIMTTSNHRPYTYPQGCIQIEGKAQSRDAAVKYSDYAIGKFIEEASSKEWFDNTLFVIIADHCASSAGKVSIPVDRYHIPCILYAPKMLSHKVVDSVCSQIDIMPTVLSLLQLPCKVRFAGQNVFDEKFQPRAFLATYQDLGYLEGDVLTVLSPVRKITQYSIQSNPDQTHTEVPLQSPDSRLTEKAQSYYQFANLYQ